MDRSKKFRLATYTAIAVNITLIVVLGVFLFWDYYATTRTHILEKKNALQDEAQILLSSVVKIGGHHSLEELQEFIDRTCASMQDSTSPGHHIVVEMPSEIMQAHSSRIASAKIFQEMKKAVYQDGGIANIDGQKMVIGYASSNEMKASVYVSEYLENVHNIGRQEVLRRTMSIAVLALTLIAMINYVLHKYITHPLDKMVLAVGQFGSGQLQTRMPDTDTRELSVFANEFNNMAARIESADNERNKLLTRLDDHKKELERFIYITSHDLRSPLVNIQGFGFELAKTVGQLEKSSDSSASIQQMREFLDYIRTSAAKMDTLIDSLLRLSRVGHAPLKIEKLDMNAMLKKIVDSMKFQINDTGTLVTIDELPQCLADNSQINQAFSNLLSNALKYLDPDRKGKIEISGRIENNMSVYSVKDNGIGIPLEHVDKIFEVFHRIEQNGASGEGIGLSIVKRIIERHDGAVRVESKPGQGSTFYVTLPNG